MNEIIKQKTAEDIAAAYEQAKEDIEKAYNLLAQAEKRMREVLGDSVQHVLIYTVDGRSGSWNSDRPKEKIDTILYKIKAATWRRIVERLGILQTMSSKEAKELSEKLNGDIKRDYRGAMIHDLDEPTVENIMALFLHHRESQNGNLETLVKEVFSLLTPREYYQGKGKKTNSKFKIGKKVILEHWCSFFSSHLDRDMTTLDRCFHVLDGKHMEGYNGPLADKVGLLSGYGKRGGVGETEYFSFKVYQNGNLHLQFKRPDLVKTINQIGGENSNVLGKGNGK